MKYSVLLAITANLIVSGCVTQETFVKKNMRYSDFERDRAACETKAAQEIAVNRSPGAEIAVALITGVYQVHDANAPARIRNYEACMMSKGYQRVSLKPCAKTDEAREKGIGPLRANQRVDVTSQTCWAGDKKGRMIFYTPTPKS